MAEFDFTIDPSSPLRPLTTGWQGKIDLGITFKQPYQEDADECMKFYSGPHDFMWNPQYKRKLWSKDLDGIAPSFRMTFNKVFEMVALFVPTLYSQNPIRTVTPRQTFLPPQDLIVSPQLTQQVAQMQQAMVDPMTGMPLPVDPMFAAQFQQMQMMLQQQQMQYQGLQMQQQMEQAVQSARAELLAMYLNYTPNELDLVGNSQAVVTEAMIKGR